MADLTLLATEDGLVPTLNRMGYMTTELDPVSMQWVEAAQATESPSADIGAAYGIATLAAVKSSKAIIISVDLDPTHLRILEEEARKIGAEDRVITLGGNFPDDVYISDGSLANILVSRVLHFFDGLKLQKSINWCGQKLQPNGRLFIVCETPYLGVLRSFIPIYEKRKFEGYDFPGFIEDVSEYSPERSNVVPPQVHLLDGEVLTRLCENAGLVVEEIVNIPRPHFPKDIQLDGRESIGMIARRVSTT